MDKGTFHTAGGLVAILLWSSTIAVARGLAEQAGALTGAAAVYSVGGLCCLAQVGWRWRREEGASFRTLSPRYLWGCGALFVLYTILLYLAVGLARSREQVLEVGLVNYLWPAATVLLSLPLLGCQARWGRLLPGTLLALAGELLVMTQGAGISWRSALREVQSNPVAYLLALVAALAWALYSNLARRWSTPGARGAVDLFIPATALALWALSFGRSDPVTWTPRALTEAAVLGVITVVAYGLWDAAMRRGNHLLVAVCSYFTPLLSTAVSCVYLGVHPGARLWVGCGLLIAGSLLSWRGVRSH